MRVFLGGAMQPELLRMSDQELTKLVCSELSKLLNIHKRRIAEINERLEQDPTLALAGGALSCVGVPGCIESGQRNDGAAHYHLRHDQKTPSKQKNR